jgi:hypothetical protein
MANVGQSTFIGSEVIIECDGSWSCCQREQAQAKVNSLNGACPSEIRGKLSRPTKRVKKRAQARAAREMDDMTPAERGQCPPAVSPCLAEELAKPGKTRAGKGLQMDHAVDTKWGGPSDPGELLALDSSVNNFFGGVAKVTGKDMRREAGLSEKSSERGPTVEKFSMICKPPCDPPKAGDENKDYSVGRRSKFPDKVEPDQLYPRPDSSARA